jgi:hypothetical protein
MVKKEEFIIGPSTGWFDTSTILSAGKLTTGQDR